MQVPGEYLFAGLLILLSLVMATGMIFVPTLVTRLLRLTRPNAQKLQPYECGITPTGGARVRFSIKFYLVAMIFILFDIEAIFLYPWAVVHRWLGVYGLIEMRLFVFILLVG